MKYISRCAILPSENSQISVAYVATEKTARRPSQEGVWTPETSTVFGFNGVAARGLNGNVGRNCCSAEITEIFVIYTRIVAAHIYKDPLAPFSNASIPRNDCVILLQRSKVYQAC
jgi:hypothetical protein